ncbi:MORN repeat protein [Aequorivita sublithincola DSM 14238]|uniref:MORN repeat protein n=1 Tax=Aequorivita sublithincola (strain DSM 14238 / LMG 21431 / ACAM 643 / 9-3) TaxID=746697 RepID=I3YYD5_AEQSU|nr:MORN repeat protein [Aequorivita sublithincola]AFL82003.1 MORN repeat protein [Aequorivita sublithincola DSM 14238]
MKYSITIYFLLVSATPIFSQVNNDEVVLVEVREIVEYNIESTYYDNGQLKSETEFDKNKNGFLTRYDENGQVSEKYIYKKGLPYTILEYRDKNGKELDWGNFKNGNGYMAGFDKDGNYLGTVFFKNGKAVGGF